MMQELIIQPTAFTIVTIRVSKVNAYLKGVVCHPFLKMV